MLGSGALMRIVAAVVLALAMGIAAPAGYATAYDGVPSIAAQDAQPDQQQRGESELPWLFAVYIITWAAFFGYVFVVSRRQREMRREIEALRRTLDERED